jgi:hypothetical protein
MVSVRLPQMTKWREHEQENRTSHHSQRTAASSFTTDAAT